MERRSCSGRVAIASARVSATTSAVWLPGKRTPITKRLLRSTRVATVVDLVPNTRSPSPCPGTARPLATGGPAGDMDGAPQLALAVHHRQPARPAPGPAAAQVPGQLLAQRPPGLDKQRQADRLMRHAHLRVIGIARLQPARDLLRRPAQLQLALNDRTQPRAPAQPGRLGTVRQAKGPPVSGTSPVPACPAVGRHLPAHRRRGTPPPAGD